MMASDARTPDDGAPFNHAIGARVYLWNIHARMIGIIVSAVALISTVIAPSLKSVLVWVFLAAFIVVLVASIVAIVASIVSGHGSTISQRLGAYIALDHVGAAARLLGRDPDRVWRRIKVEIVAGVASIVIGAAVSLIGVRTGRN